MSPDESLPAPPSALAREPAGEARTGGGEGADDARADDAERAVEEPAKPPSPPPAPSPSAGEDAPTPSRPPRLAIALAAAAALGIAWALGVALERGDEVASRADDQQPRVRIALIDAAPEVVLGLDGSWRAEPDVGEPLLLERAGELTVRPLGGGLSGLAVQADRGAGFAGASALTLRPIGAPPHEPAPPFELAGRRYRGWLTIRLREDGGLQAINSVAIEDYLAGVIGHEMPISWADEALEAQAIASRTYALSNLKPAADYDLEADVRSQVYRGVLAEDERARALVAATRGLVVSYEGELVTTYFHSTCGGDTVPARWIFAWVKEDVPPLRGATDCPCRPSRYYRWEKTVDPAEAGLEVALPLRAVEVDHRPRGGYATRVVLTGADGETLELDHWQTRRRLKLRSYAFDLELADGGMKLAARGRGWGHGVGMCQYGARGRAKQGSTAEQILEHYYPGAEVDRLGY